MKSNPSQKSIPDGWQQVKLSDVSEFINGYTFKSSMYSDNGLYKIITIANVQDGFMFIDEPKLIDELPSDINNDQILKKGDILVSMTGNVGRVCIVDADNCLLNQRVGKIKPKRIDTSLLYFFLYDRTFLNQMIDSAQGGAQGNLSTGDIKKYEFSIPKLEEEQTRIVSVLETWDRALELLGQKIEAKKQIKKGLMQDLLTGKKRLSGFDINWSEKKLADFTELIHGDGNWILSENISESGRYKVVQLGSIGLGRYIHKKLKTLSEVDFSKVNGTLLMRGDLLINRMVDGNLNLCLFMETGEYVTTVDVCWIRENTFFDNYFLMQLMLLDSSQSELLSLSSGSGRIRISKKNLFEKFKLNMPKIDEQKAISKVLITADQEIATLEKKLSILKEQKRYLLNNLITGTIRTPVDLV